MTKGKPWSIEEELRLKEFYEAGMSVSDIALKLSKSDIAVIMKLKRLGLRDADTQKRLMAASSDELKLPEDLPNIDDAGKILGAAMLGMTQKNLSKFDLERYKTAADIAWKYKEFIVDYINMKRLQKQVFDLRVKVERLEAGRADDSAK